MEQTKRLLVQVKSDIEHLANKVHHLKAVSYNPHSHSIRSPEEADLVKTYF
jgi:hypothetical protein